MAIIMLSVLMVPIASETAHAVPINSDGNKLNNITAYCAQSTCNAPSQSELMQQGFVSNSTLATTNWIASFSTQSNGSKSENPFTYAFATYVKTKGQVDVPAYSTVGDYTDYTAAEKAEIITYTEAYYPEVEILGNPTSTYNCHSYAWYSNTKSNPYWINDVGLFANDVHTSQIGTIENARVGDIIVYLDANNSIIHSAIIAEINEDQVICHSKWGTGVLCEHEYRYIPSDYCASDTTFLYYVLRVTPHVWSYEPSGINQHTRTCTICGYAEQLNCNYSYTYTYDDMHNASCVDCGYAISGAFCSFTSTSNGNRTHTRSCNGCSNAYTESCNLDYNYTSFNHHIGECSICGYTTSELSCNLYCTYTGDGSSSHTHEGTCQVCGYDISETCTFAYMYHSTTDGANYHVSKCTGCNHTKGKAIQCLYDSENNCLVCGVSKYFIATAAVNVDTLME